jgi:GTP 3',8-cyclase
MTERIIPLYDHRSPTLALPAALQPVAANGLLADTRGRPLRDLRISVTDRCNFRCTYCMPKEVFDKDYAYLPHSALLSFEEITRVARAAVAHGVRKIRLTGGEPLLRKNLERLIEQLAALRTPEGHALDLTLTTNASLLAKKAQSLKDAGLQRITVSLDALDDARFNAMNDVDFPVRDVLDGIEAARAVGFESIKVNMVVKRGTNDTDVAPMAAHFRGTGVTLRFIEYMDVGATNGWRMDEVLPSADVVARVAERFALVPLAASAEGETAQRYGYAGADGLWDRSLGEIGTISSVTQAFCGDCNRARLSTDGKLYTCLFATSGFDLRGALREGSRDALHDRSGDADLEAAIAHIWGQRSDRYSELRGSAQAPARGKVEMSYIGG